MKYIVFNNDTFAIIPDSASHSDVVKFPNSVMGAGFCSIQSYRNDYDDIRYKINCYGESETLKIKSRGKVDADIISMGMH